MVGDLTNQSDTDQKLINMYAYQAQRLKASYRREVLQCMLEYDEDFDTPWERSMDSLLEEWEDHMILGGNLMFGLISFDRSANIDFDNAEEGKDFWYFAQKAFNAIA